MIILSHRGYWRTPEEKNTITAFARSFSYGFGTETDLRDFDRDLVISHDPADASAIRLNAFFKCYCDYSTTLPLAINIKADGLQQLLLKTLREYCIRDYFVFDMSIPDMLLSIKVGLTVFTRQSEYELEPALYAHAKGVWIDCFETEWVSQEVIEKHLLAGKQVCLVSPELHKRSHEAFWDRLNEMSITDSPNIMLCTDHPEEARRVFG